MFLQESTASPPWLLVAAGVVLAGAVAGFAVLKGLLQSVSGEKRWSPPPSRSRITEADFKKRRR